MEKVQNNMLISNVDFLEAELGSLNASQIELANILSVIDFDFDEFEPIFVQFPGTKTHYIYQARRDALVDIDDEVIVPTGNNDIFKVAKVSMTYLDLDSPWADDINIDLVRHVVEQYGEVRYIVANLGHLDGAFFEDYFYDTKRKKRKNELLKAIEKRAKIAQQSQVYQNIAKHDAEMEKLLQELDKIGGF